MFYGGVFFGFQIVLPLGINFLLDFGGAGIEPVISLDRYISFLITLLIPFGLIFQMPLIMNLLFKLGILSVQTVAGMRRYVVILIFVFGAIITPPDIITQILLALPLLLLFEGSLLIGKLTN